ncbi:MAG: hypothetical protein KatS3mg057_2827 [Herpetosiphonaceae bacterium]|nr:MAG: hypothetical protein KatS3mg057_2827 [Herpetosiphonaceae bacterium]
MFIKGNFAPGLSYPGIFDGIDIDWEYPGACGNTCNYRPEDTQNFTALLAEFRSQLNQLSQQTGKAVPADHCGAGRPGEDRQDRGRQDPPVP